MPNVTEFQSYLLNEEGNLTAESISKGLGRAVEEQGIRDLVIMAVNSDGEIVYAYNDMGILKFLGILDSVKHMAFEKHYQERR